MVKSKAMIRRLKDWKDSFKAKFSRQEPQQSLASEETLTGSRVRCRYCTVCTKGPYAGACRPRAVPTPAPAPAPTPAPAPAPVANTTQIPNEVLPLPGGLKVTQIDTIFSLVSIAENSTTRWYNNYTYCENIGDGRGLTVSLVGFCSGTHDLLWVMQALQRRNAGHPLCKYLPALKTVDGTASTAGLESFCADLARYGDTYWRQAVWDGIVYFYWTPAMNFAASVGCTSDLARGFFFDTSLNHGSQALQQFASRVTVPRPNAGGNEAAWIRAFIDVRQRNIQYEDRSTNNGQPDRCIMWRSILDKNNLALTRPITGLVCYGDSFSIV